ncbi:aldose epimerase [Leptospira perolatii]|uniref:Aldose epimerase n=2 Tax=Leptospira perolatii TaxID=2023191 RepID=A0A2M9ZK42_9LEPT|nr:aldose epimerase [Leptospira perolatii]PJZ72313.1 aldose epimerase [Leptospira perolatii]
MLTLRTSSSKLTTDGTRWTNWDWVHPRSKKMFGVLHTALPGDSSFGFGSFLMYPWVNRHSSETLVWNGKDVDLSNAVRDSHGFPLHGLVHSLPRKVLSGENAGSSAEFRVIFPEIWEENPISAIAIQEELRLEDSSQGTILTVTTKFFNTRSESIRFAYGYHPTFQLLGHREDWRIHLHMDKNIELDDKMLPLIPTVGNPIESFATGELQNLDHLFFGQDPRVILENRTEKYSISVMSLPEEGKIQLCYFQIYVPRDRNSAAIEPCSSPGNALMSGQGLIELKGHSEKSGEFRIMVQSL